VRGDVDEVRQVLVATARRYLADGMIDRAPGLAYYGILSLFPLLLLGFTLMRFVGGADAPDELAELAREEGASGPLSEALRSVAQTARQATHPTAGAAGLAGVLALVYGGSRAFTAAGRALDVIAGDTSTQRGIARRAQDIAWTLVVLTMVIVLVFLLLASERVVEELLGLVGLDDDISVWTLVRWPAVVGIALLIVAIVRWAAPTGGRPPFRLVTRGAGLSVLVLVVATIGFDVYVANFASYNTTYGAFAGGVILLLWIWLACIAFLLGAELDAVLSER
jgi:membrane protein